MTSPLDSRSSFDGLLGRWGRDDAAPERRSRPTDLLAELRLALQAELGPAAAELQPLLDLARGHIEALFAERLGLPRAGGASEADAEAPAPSKEEQEERLAALLAHLDVLEDATLALALGGAAGRKGAP